LIIIVVPKARLSPVLGTAKGEAIKLETTPPEESAENRPTRGAPGGLEPIPIIFQESRF
jgi:hypothetical protein